MPNTLKQFKSASEKTDFVRQQTYNLKPKNAE